MEPNYVERARNVLSTLISVDDELLDLYTLLVLVKGDRCLLDDVHEAWAIWRSRTDSAHRSLIPFNQLRVDVQELDREYMLAIHKTAEELAPHHA